MVRPVFFYACKLRLHPSVTDKIMRGGMMSRTLESLRTPVLKAVPTAHSYGLRLSLPHLGFRLRPNANQRRLHPVRPPTSRLDTLRGLNSWSGRGKSGRRVAPRFSAV